jgi:choloylglycine hydrolase
VICLKLLRACSLAAFVGVSAFASQTQACTGIRLVARDGSIVYGRTMEFAPIMNSEALVIPRNLEMTGTAPGSKPGMRWRTKYGAVGLNAFNQPVIVDGVNERGLAVGAFYFPGYAKYNEVTESEFDCTVAPYEFPTILLTSCASVADVIELASRLKVAEVSAPGLGICPPLHFVAHDAHGNSIVLEHVEGKLVVHNNPVGVITNSPTFDWHMTNLENYVNLTDANKPALELESLKLNGFGQGTGMLGMPGDFTPPSRFVRAVMFSATTEPMETGRDAVLRLFHLLNLFDLPYGAIREVDGNKQTVEYTQWTSGSDLKNLRFYFRTVTNSRIRTIDLNQIDLDAASIRSIPTAEDEVFEDLSADETTNAASLKP